MTPPLELRRRPGVEDASPVTHSDSSSSPRRRRPALLLAARTMAFDDRPPSYIGFLCFSRSLRGRFRQNADTTLLIRLPQSEG